MTAAAACSIWTRSRQERLESSGLINAEQNSLYGGELCGIYIVLRFIVKIWDGSNNQKGEIKIRCDNLSGVLDSLQIALKQNGKKHSGQYYEQ